MFNSRTLLTVCSLGSTEVFFDNSWLPIVTGEQYSIRAAHFSTVTLDNKVYKFGGHYTEVRRNYACFFDGSNIMASKWTRTQDGFEFELSFFQVRAPVTSFRVPVFKSYCEKHLTALLNFVPTVLKTLFHYLNPERACGILVLDTGQ